MGLDLDSILVSYVGKTDFYRLTFHIHSLYSGRARLIRLKYIADHFPTFAQEACKLGLNEMTLDKPPILLYDISLYHYFRGKRKKPACLTTRSDANISLGQTEDDDPWVSHMRSLIE